MRPPRIPARSTPVVIMQQWLVLQTTWHALPSRIPTEHLLPVVGDTSVNKGTDKRTWLTDIDWERPLTPHVHVHVLNTSVRSIRLSHSIEQSQPCVCRTHTEQHYHETSSGRSQVERASNQREASYSAAPRYLPPQSNHHHHHLYHHGIHEEHRCITVSVGATLLIINLSSSSFNLFNSTE